MRNKEPPAKSKMAARGSKMADRVWKGVQPMVIGHSEQLSLNKFFLIRAMTNEVVLCWVWLGCSRVGVLTIKASQ